ncbi:MAG: GNAT family N-acetyltransferase [Saprospiraceae bacterium]|nr:GNAT family N-acetyltransferase [Saprospiraceae bacterium]
MPVDTPADLLRPWTLEDVPNLIRLGGNEKVARFMTDAFPHPYTEEHARQFIQKANSQEPARILAITSGQEAIGGIGLHPGTDIYRRNAELGYWLGEPFWGQGIMTKAIRNMVSYGFEHLDIHRIYARPFHTNIGSQRALEKAGFILEARLEGTIIKNEEILDELIYAIRR